MKLQQGARGKCAFSAVSNFHLIIPEFAHANAYNALEIVQKQEEVSVGLAAYLVLMLYFKKTCPKGDHPRTTEWIQGHSVHKYTQIFVSTVSCSLCRAPDTAIPRRLKPPACPQALLQLWVPKWETLVCALTP